MQHHGDVHVKVVVYVVEQHVHYEKQLLAYV